MKKKKFFLQGLYAGITLATIFWLSELMFCVGGGLLSFVTHRQFPWVDFGEILRALPVYLLFCTGAGTLLAGICQNLFLIYSGLLGLGVGLFEWVGRGEGTMRLLWGVPWAHPEVWAVVLFFFGFLGWSSLRQKKVEEIKRDALSIFLTMSLLLLFAQTLRFELQTSSLLEWMLQDGEKFERLWISGILWGLSFVSLLSFFLVRKGMGNFLKMRKITQVIFSFSLLTSLLGYLPRVLPVPSSEKPNIVLIVLDTVRADHLSSYGYPKKTSPFFDQLAKEGVLFEEAKTTSYWSLPSHASLFTGLLPSSHGADAETFKLQEDYQTLAAHLRAQGYRTVGFSENGIVGQLTGLHRGFDQLVELWTNEHRSLATRIEANLQHLHPASAPNLNLLFRHWLPHEKHRPLFLFVNYIEAHRKYKYHPGVSESFWSEPWSLKDIESLEQTATAFLYFTGKLTYSEKDLRLLSDLYDGEIAYLDQHVKELVETLRQNGVLDNGILIITSDHGEYLGEHGLVSHVLCLYEEVLRIPILMWYPRKIPAGRIQETVQLTDLAPTLLELAGLKPLEGIDGRSFVPLLRGEAWVSSPVIAEQSRPILWMELLKRWLPQADFSTFDYSSTSFQEGNYKVIFSSHRPPELYDLNKDRRETHNLYETFRDHPILNHLKDYLARREERKVTASTFSESPKERMRILKSLGYL